MTRSKAGGKPGTVRYDDHRPCLWALLAENDPLQISTWVNDEYFQVSAIVVMPYLVRLDTVKRGKAACLKQEIDSRRKGPVCPETLRKTAGVA